MKKVIGLTIALLCLCLIVPVISAYQSSLQRYYIQMNGYQTEICACVEREKEE